MECFFNGDLICVPKMNGDCPNECPTECLDNEMVCNGPPLEGNCPGPEFCLPLKDDNGCDNLCPIFCPEGEKPCPSLIDDNDCVLSQVCHPMDQDCPDLNGICAIGQKSCLMDPDTGFEWCIPEVNPINDCPTFCPTFCDEDNEIRCPGITDNNGCQTMDVCLPKLDASGCPNSCPVSCDEGFKFCKGLNSKLSSNL